VVGAGRRKNDSFWKVVKPPANDFKLFLRYVILVSERKITGPAEKRSHRKDGRYAILVSERKIVVLSSQG